MKKSKGVALVADDVQINQTFFRSVLEALGLTVLSAVNGREAIQITSERLANKERLDIIFMDMMMPEVSGIQATQEIRTAGYEGPILAFSADVSRRTADRALEAGANHYFLKTTFKLDLARALIDKFCYLDLD